MGRKRFVFYILIPLFVVCVQAQSIEIQDKMFLWPDRTDESGERETPRKKKDYRRITDVSSPSITIYPVEGKELAPAVMVCPGGGYKILTLDKEGTEIAKWLNSQGIAAILLKYRVPEDRFGALQDAQRAMGLIRANSVKWNVDPARLGVIGFSAGGHLAASLSTTYEKRTYPAVDSADDLKCRPDFTILVYPAYLGDEEYRLPEEVSVTGDTPPAFMVQTQDDTQYVNSSMAYYLALKKNGIKAELHLLPEGGHGYGLLSSKRISCWPKLCEQWLNEMTKKGWI